MKLLSPATLSQWLRAAGDPSRLRLLALCMEGALSVCDLAGALRQSEPRTSRHLKILCDAGLIERMRQGQRVHYRISGQAAAASFGRGLLGLLDRADPVLAQDRSAARALSVSCAPLGGESRLGRTLASLLTADAPGEPTGPLLLLGVRHPELLASAARISGGCTAVAQSRRAAQWARAFAERAGIACRIIEAASADGFSDADLARCGGPFAGIVLDQPSGAAAALPQILRRARAALAPGGRLWLFEHYDSLDTARDRIVEHPLARLRRLLSDAGLQCEKISPVEADGEHFLAARALAATADASLRGRTGAA
jgi:DNA-binding transcriptional ArsR family regulator